MAQTSAAPSQPEIMYQGLLRGSDDAHLISEILVPLAYPSGFSQSCRVNSLDQKIVCNFI